MAYPSRPDSTPQGRHVYGPPRDGVNAFRSMGDTARAEDPAMLPRCAERPDRADAVLPAERDTTGTMDPMCCQHSWMNARRFPSSCLTLACARSRFGSCSVPASGHATERSEWPPVGPEVSRADRHGARLSGQDPPLRMEISTA